LLCGIAYDSKLYSIGQSTTYKTVSDLINLGASNYDVKQILLNEMETSEKIARIKHHNEQKSLET